MSTLMDFVFALGLFALLVAYSHWLEAHRRQWKGGGYRLLDVFPTKPIAQRKTIVVSRRSNVHNRFAVARRDTRALTINSDHWEVKLDDKIKQG